MLRLNGSALAVIACALLVAFSAGFLVVVVTKGKQKDHEAPSVKQEEPQQEPIQALPASNIAVVVQRAAMRYPMYNDRSGKVHADTEEPFLHLHLFVQNTTETRKVDYRRWSQLNSGVALADNLGNHYRQMSWPGRTYLPGMGHGPNIYQALDLTAINPGKGIDDLLIFQEPIGVAKTLRLLLPGQNVGEASPVIVDIDTATIEAWPSRR